VSLIYCTEPNSRSGKTGKLKSKNTDMLRSISKQSGESVESVPEKKRKATVGTWEGFAEKEGLSLE